MLQVAGGKLVIAAPDHDQVLIVDASTREVLARVDVSDEPSHVALFGNTAVVTTRFGHTLEVIHITSGQRVRSITVGSEPVGLTFLDERRVAVVLSGEAIVIVVNITTGSTERSFALEAKDPRAVAFADGKLLVTHITAGVLSEIVLESGTVRTRSAATVNPHGPQVQPNLMRSVTVAPDGKTILVAHSQANAETVRAPIGDSFDSSVGGGCGYGGCPQELPSSTPAITEIDVDTGAVLVPAIDDPSGQGGMNGGMMEPDFDCFDCFGVPMATNPPSFLNPNEARFFGVPLNNASAIALFDGGRGMLVLHTGSRNVVMLRRALSGEATDVLGVVNVGHGAFSISVSEDGTRAFVFNQFDGSITEFELPVLEAEVKTTGKLVPAASSQSRPAELGQVPVIAAVTWSVLDDALEPLVSKGRKLFHDALDSRISESHSVSCATCHPDGRHDGQTWRFTFGPRNTPQLGGGILDTAPFHWPGDVTTHRDLNTLTILAFMGGTGLDESSMDAIGAFIDTIRAAPAPSALAAELSEAQERGKAIFDSTEAACIECHTGAHFTDNKNWDLGTRSDSSDRRDFQTPVLHGLERSAPYLHDGSVRTLQDLVNQVIRTDRMGKGSHLTDQDAQDLTEYLRTL
jgi:DNA-binding beta-propeller fold protein YncE/mono/diheme cytochrome c family protein